MTTGPDDHSLRRELIETCRAMEGAGLTRGTSGNVSVRSGDGFLISPTGIGYAALTPALVVRMGMDGTAEGAVLPSSEWRFHRDILVRRPELSAVVHTHSPYATSMAILGVDIPAIHYGIAAAGGSDIRCAGYALFGTQALSDAVLAALEGRRACLMAHHGAIACGAGLARALALAVTVEELAQQYMLCSAVRAPPVLTHAQIVEVLAKFDSYGQQPASQSTASGPCSIRGST